MDKEILQVLKDIRKELQDIRSILEPEKNIDLSNESKLSQFTKYLGSTSIGATKKTKVTF